MRLSPTIGMNRCLKFQPIQHPAVVVYLFSLLFLLTPSIAAQSSKKPSPSNQPVPDAAAVKSPAIAEVDGNVITSEEVESGLGVQLVQLEEQIYQIKRQRIEAMISEKLSNQEAARRGVTIQSLLDTEVTAKAAAVTDLDVTAFYQANRGQMGQLDANLIARIKSYLQGQRINARREEFLQSLRANAKIVVNLPRPNQRIKIPVEGAPFKGGANAPVTIVEFSDYHCPFCIRVQGVLSQVLARYGDQVKLVYRDMPIDQLHPQARRAAEAAHCANDQGKFWPYHDQLYLSGADVSPEKLKSIAQSSGLDVAAFESCLASGKHRAYIQQSIDGAARLGLSGTPAFLINGRFLSGAQPLEAFVSVIEEELAQARANGDKPKPRQ
ncbi:MAG: thioredoxin domain-containing protein [Acidobacteriota bacterium]